MTLLRDKLERSTLCSVRTSDIGAVARIFCDCSEDIDIISVGQGNINDTYVIDTIGKKIILQRINSNVFPDPQKVAENFGRISKFLKLRIPKKKRISFPEVIPTPSGNNFYKDRGGNIWRAQRYIENTKVYEKLVLPERASQVGKCLARFHNLVKDMLPTELDVTLPGFHNLPLYVKKYDEAVKRYCQEISDELRFCQNFVEKNRIHAHILERLREKREVAMSVTHGDPKVSNVLFDRESHKALTLIDFDTVGPGLLLYDIGDCLRSCCCSIDENEYGRAPVRCELDMVDAMLQGYFNEKDLSSLEKNHIYESLYLITFELGLRFLTDYLQGNRYFKITHRYENLHRALVQFELVTSICQQQDAIRKLVEQTSKTATTNR